MEESITFREATLDDLPFMSNGVYQVFEAENLLNVYKKDVEDVKIKRAIEGNRVFIAEQNNGIISYYISSHQISEIRLYSICLQR